uniref:Glutamine--fructose-6-phosphate aminotransferase [isomerizing] n=1 Tax=Palpitomonas bilix TaxID=652834 RepID=A0A7S3LV03_9EUKA|mmetsp:Transcript_48656/g.126259  ORF Transcript_48656/g.126259 Transcript_48656/m.126259 type:complete len:539 (+) Transcript_48656:58-1674(+)
MCGITGYLGYKNALSIILTGLKRLEYRGYDSAGAAVVVDEGDGSKLMIRKSVGKVAALEQACSSDETMKRATVGVGHTRWATHGAPSDINAHPHASSSGRFAMVHNGIIENFAELKAGLERSGYKMKSETDTEVLVCLIESIQKQSSCTLEEAVRLALHEVEGAYAIVIVTADNPDMMIGARKGSPLVLGFSDDECFLASDAAPFVDHTDNIIYFNEGDIVTVTRTRDGDKCKVVYSVTDLSKVATNPTVEKLELTLEEITKGGYDHYMLKEIMEQPTAIKNALRGRLTDDGIRLGGLNQLIERPNGEKLPMIDAICKANRIIISACGTSWHAGLIGEYLIEELAGINVEVEYASEFRYRTLVLDENDVILVISQSGETADTLEAVRIGRANGCTVCGICNKVGSAISRETDAGVYLHAGPEIGVASTKAFTAQVTVLTLIALAVGRKRGVLLDEKFFPILEDLRRMPELLQRVIDNNIKVVEDVSKVYRYAHNFLFLGRGYNFPVALEGALKLKEISYIHAEGLPVSLSGWQSYSRL